ncbi:MAG TPA: amidohydrolase family protein [Burkholderiales bacterium]|nr:amidohydrolase family protein [Burkholderiales bacterium]
MNTDADLPIIDAHQHFWDLEHNRHPWLQDLPLIPFRYGDYTAIRRNYLPADFRRDCGTHRVLKTVYVEAEWDPQDPVGETRWVSALAAAQGLPNAIVAQAWLDRVDAAEVLAAQAAFPLVRAVRHKPRAAASPAAVVVGAPGSMGDLRWRAGYARLARHGLHFELQTPWWQLGEAVALARDFPETRIVLNHSGLPADRSPEGLAGWAAAMHAFAACPNVAVKISGLGLPGRAWRVEDNAPVVRQVIETFGVERCMFASNYPVDGLVASYDTIMSGFKAIVAERPLAERRALFHDNAARIYRIA